MSYIYTNGDELTARFVAASEGTTQRVASIFATLGSADGNDQATQIISQMPPEVFGPFINEIIAGLIAQEITSESCVPVNRILELLDPMPAQNTADLIGYIVKFVAEQDAKKATAPNG